MKEYTLLAILSVIVAILVDRLLGTKLTSKREFGIFWLIMFCVIFIVNGYLTWRPIVTYGNEYYLNIRLFTIPIEDFLYGFSLLTLNIVIWECYSRKKIKKDKKV